MKVLSLSVSLVLLLLSATSYAAPIRFDANDNDAVANPPGNPPPSPTQSGWIGLTQTGLTGVASDFGTLDVSFVGIIADVNGVNDRDRGRLDSGNHPLSDLLRDLIFVSANSTTQGDGTMDLVVSGLAAGHYKSTGYFHDNSVNHNLMDVAVSVDGGANFTLKIDDAATSTTTTPASVGTGTLYFTANGTDAVYFRLIGEGGTVGFATTETAILSGFEIDVPEPSSILLAVMSVALLCSGQLIHRKTSVRS